MVLYRQTPLLLSLLLLPATQSFMLPLIRSSFRAGSRGLLGTCTRKSGFSMVLETAPPKVGLRPSPSHPSYELVSEDFIKEYGTSAALYRHKKSGAEVLSIQADDDNKVFGISFRTPPEDSTGVPHILEHSVLCGSRKYPVKEPFVDLLKGSLQTFLNAFTYPDRTCYPVASQNTKDFYNLINVYLDAVLFPRAVVDPLVMEQEGWHYELEDPSQPLTYKGVVFNEMKGVYSSSDSLHGRASQQAVFPDNTYGVDSGGDPVAIPNLTFDYFKNFHRRFYHPANSRIYFYGDDPVPKRLELLDEYLREFDASAVDPKASSIEWQPKRTAPWRHVEKFPCGEDGVDKHMVSVNWLLNDEELTPKEELCLDILDDLLMGNSAATLRKALTDSGLGASVIGGGLSTTLMQGTFSAGLKGVPKDKVQEVEDLILSTLQKCATDGFEKSAIAASVNSAEFELREFNTGSFPRGLSLMLGALNNWIYDRSPTEGLKFEAQLASLKEDLAQGKPVFEDILKKYLVNNSHRVTVEMVPDVKYEEAVENEEKSRLEKVKASMTPQDLADVVAATERLKAAQAAEDTPEAKATLPILSISDLDKKVKSIPIDVTEVEGVKVVTHDLPSSGILYADVGLDISAIPLSEYPLLGLFSRMLLETGAGNMDRVELSRHINTQTGGVYASSMVSSKINDDGSIASGEDLVAYMFLKGKAVSSKVPELMDIIKLVLSEAHLDSQQRVVEMLKETKARMQSSVVEAGHSYASTRIDARYTLEAYLNEISGGVTFLNTVKELLETAEKDWPSMLARLEKIRSILVQKNNLIVNLTGDKDVLTSAEGTIKSFITSMPATATSRKAAWASEAKLLPVENEGFAVQTQVNYVGKGGQLYMPGERVPGSALVVSRYIRNSYLWDNVRVMGGAYGGFCNFNPNSGLFSFLSYRDPNLDKTVAIYDGTADYLKNLHLPDEELEMSVIGAVGDMDSPQSADQKGFLSLKRHLVGMTEETRQRVRDEAIATSHDDFAAFGDRLVALNKKAKTAVVGSKAALESANAARGEGEKFKVTEL